MTTLNLEVDHRPEMFNIDVHNTSILNNCKCGICNPTPVDILVNLYEGTAFMPILHELYAAEFEYDDKWLYLKQLLNLIKYLPFVPCNVVTNSYWLAYREYDANGNIVTKEEVAKDEQDYGITPIILTKEQAIADGLTIGYDISVTYTKPSDESEWMVMNGDENNIIAYNGSDCMGGGFSFDDWYLLTGLTPIQAWHHQSYDTNNTIVSLDTSSYNKIIPVIDDAIRIVSYLYDLDCDDEIVLSDEDRIIYNILINIKCYN